MDRRRALVEAALIVAALALGGIVEHARPGVERLYLALAVLLLGPLFRRWLVVRGRVEGAPIAAFACELAAFSGLLVYPMGRWAHALAGIGALATGLPSFRGPRDDGPRATPLEEAVALATGVGSALLWLLGAGEPALPLAPILLVAFEAYGPGAARGARDAARRAAAFALSGAAAVAHGQESIELRAPAEHILVALAFVAALGAVAALAREGDREPARGGWALRALFGGVLALVVSVLVLHPAIERERSVDLATAPRVQKLAGHAALAEFSRFVLGAFPADGAVLREDGAPLLHPGASHADIATIGSGRYSVWNGRTVHWSSSDNSDPLSNGRRYALAFEPDVLQSLPFRGLVVAACALGLLAWRAGALALGGVSPLGTRLFVAFVTIAALGAGLPRRWNHILVQPDSSSYVCHSHVRPLLYPAFIDFFDREPEKPVVTVPPTKGGPAPNPGHRYLRVIQSQKVLTVLSLGILVFALASGINAWLVGALTYLGVMVDLAEPGFVWDSAMSFNMGTLMSEGLNQPLTFLALAALFSYLLRPRWLTGIGLALLVAAMLLTRPANASFVSVFLVVAVHHLAREGWRPAIVRSGVLALAFAAPILGACAHNHHKTGYFRLHAFTGMNVLCTAFQAATVEDIDAFEDPEVREFLRVCLVDNAHKRIADYRDNPGGDYVNVNLHEIALPAFGKVVKLPPEKAALGYYVADDMFLKIGKKLIARHPREFLGLVLFHLERILDWKTLLPLALAFAAGAILWLRTRRAELLFLVFFAAIPAVSMLPSCIFNFPLWRYRSQLYFAEVLAAPLLAAILATLGRRAFEVRKEEGGPT